MPPLFDINAGTLLGAIWVHQRQAEQRRFLDELGAERRHQEMLDALEAAADHDEDFDWAEPPESPTRLAPAASPAPEPTYFGPRLGVASLKLPDVGTVPLPADPEALRSLLDPPNLLVVGGTEDDGWAVAQAIQQVLGGELRGVRLGGLRSPDLAVVVTNLGDDDVLFVPLPEDASQVAVDALGSMLVPEQRERRVLKDLDERDRLVRAGVAHEEANERVGFEVDTPYGRWFTMQIGTGASARPLSLHVPVFPIVGWTGSRRVPAPLAAWGGQVLVPKDTKVCPDCAEEVKAAARICRFCRYEFDPEPVGFETERPSLFDSPTAPAADRPPDPRAGPVATGRDLPRPAVVGTGQRAPADPRIAQLRQLLEMALEEGGHALRRDDTAGVILWVEWTGDLVASALGSDAAGTYRRLGLSLRSSGLIANRYAIADFWEEPTEALIRHLDEVRLREGFDPGAWQRPTHRT